MIPLFPTVIDSSPVVGENRSAVCRNDVFGTPEDGFDENDEAKLDSKSREGETWE